MTITASSLKPDGRLFLLCEPIGHVFRESVWDGYLRELQLGAYEQSFLEWEYAQLLEEGGFTVIDGMLDVGSAKIIAVTRPVGHTAGVPKRQQ